MEFFGSSDPFDDVVQHMEKVAEDLDLYTGRNEEAYGEFSKLAPLLIQELQQGDLHEVLNAVSFAAQKHRGQVRKNIEKTPYISHPLRVSHILLSEGEVFHKDILVASLLHDCVEDTETTFEEIQESFGVHVRFLVEQVTDDKSLPKEERKRLQIEHASFISPEAKLIKLADKLANLRDLEGHPPENWPEERVQGYYHWAFQVVEGLRGVNDEMESQLDHIFHAHGVVEKDGDLEG